MGKVNWQVLKNVVFSHLGLLLGEILVAMGSEIRILLLTTGVSGL